MNIYVWYVSIRSCLFFICIHIHTYLVHPSAITSCTFLSCASTGGAVAQVMAQVVAAAFSSVAAAAAPGMVSASEQEATELGSSDEDPGK